MSRLKRDYNYIFLVSSCTVQVYFYFAISLTIKILKHKTQDTLLYLFLAYLVLAPILYLFFVKEYSENKSYLFFRALLRNLKAFFQRQGNFSLEHEEKVALLFILVKLFFLPTMITLLWKYRKFTHFQE